MGNYITTATQKLSSSQASGKVILPDGTVYVFDKPLTVAELMLEHPRQVVVELTDQGLTSQKRRPSPLPADKMLEMRKVYLMLPKKRGGKVASLSSEEARCVLLSADKVLRSRASTLSSSMFLPLFARMCPVGGTGEGEKFVVERKDINLKEEKAILERNNSGGIVDDEMVESRPEYLSRQLSGKGWKPSLDPITEKKVGKKKLTHWLF